MAQTDPREFPWEYQTEMGAAQQRALIAQQLAKMVQPPSPITGRMVSGHYVRTSPVQHLANLMYQVSGNEQARKAQEQMQAARIAYNQGMRGDVSEIARLMTPDPGTMGTGEAPGEATNPRSPDLMAAERRAMTSPYPEVQELAKGIWEQRKNLFNQAAPVSSAQSIIQSGGQPTALQPSTWSGPRLQEVPGMGTVAEYTSGRGEMKTPTLQKPAIPPGTKFGWGLIEKELGDMQKLRPEVLKAEQTLKGVIEAASILKSGVLNTGAMANTITQIQSLASIFGQKVPENVPATQYFNSMLLPQIANAVRSVAPVGSTSDRELNLAQQLMLSAERDPRMIGPALRQTALALASVQADFNSRLNQGKGIASRSEVDPAFFGLLTVPTTTDPDDPTVKWLMQQRWGVPGVPGTPEPSPVKPRQWPGGSYQDLPRGP